MTITKKKLRSGTLALALVAAISVFPTASAHAASLTSSVDPCAGIEYETIQSPADVSMADYVKGLTMLTESEKQQLIDESVAAQPIYDRISALDSQIDTITNQILKEGNALFEEREQISGQYKELWEKLWYNMNDTQEALDDYTAIIKASTALTDSEKAVLTEVQAHLEVIEANIDSYYAKAAEATSELAAQRDQAIAELDALYAKSAHVWAKVYGE